MWLLYTQTDTASYAYRGGHSPRPRRVTVIMPALDDSGHLFPYRPLHVSSCFLHRINLCGIYIVRNRPTVITWRQLAAMAAPPTAGPNMRLLDIRPI